MLRFVLIATLSTFSTASVLAEKNTLLDTRISKVGSADFVEMFDDELSEDFQVSKGKWKIQDGVLIGGELKSDNHAAVINLRKKNRNSVVRFSFKLDDQTQGFSFSLNRKGGHLFRAVVAPTNLSINLDKDKKDPKSKAIVLSRQKAEFGQGKWYTMQVEMVADTVLVQTDNGVIAKARHPQLDTDKPNYRFVMKGNTLSIDDLRVWNVKSR